VRIFDRWVIVYLRCFYCRILGLLFSTVNFDKQWLGYILCDFFTNSSGQPGGNVCI
jgi:hypothetical protein